MAHPTLSPFETVVQCGGYIVSDMDGEKVMLGLEQGKYYNLGELGGEIWDLMAEPTTASRIAERLLERYEVERDVCEAQVLSFLGDLLRENLIRVARSA